MTQPKDRIDWTLPIAVPSDFIPTFSATRVEDMLPSQYRLVCRGQSVYVLQGMFVWREGNEMGADWKDLPTIHE